MKYEFAVLGSGISAKITSSLLAKNGFSVCLILDKDQSQEVSNTNLVTFLSTGSLNYLSSIIPHANFFQEYPEIQKIKCNLNSLKKDKAQSITFNNENKSLGKIVKNSDLEKYLNEEINQLSSIDVINSNQIDSIENTATGIELKFSGNRKINSNLLILSTAIKNILEQINISFIKKDLKQTALSINLTAQIKNKNCAFQEFTKYGPLAFLPYSDDEASVVWSLKNNSQILSKDSKELTQLIEKHLHEHVTSMQIISVEKHSLQFTYAKNLFYKNTVLLGNIAHNIHPIAGQGLNLSIKDIALFVKLIRKYTSLGYRLNDKMILEEFEIKRKLDNLAYSFGTFSLNDVLTSENKFLNFATRQGLNIVDKNKYLKRFFIKSATGLDFFNSL